MLNRPLKSHKVEQRNILLISRIKMAFYRAALLWKKALQPSTFKCQENEYVDGHALQKHCKKCCKNTAKSAARDNCK
jgi:hypothetical protein